MSMIFRVFIFFMCLSSVNLLASDRSSDVIIHFEETPFKDASIFCEEDNDILPKRNDFKIIDYALMSSNQGHRYALITIENTSTGLRTMNEVHMIAVLANCKIIHPINFERSFKGSEIITTEVNFGLNRFPIIKVTTER